MSPYEVRTRAQLVYASRSVILSLFPRLSQVSDGTNLRWVDLQFLGENGSFCRFEKIRSRLPSLLCVWVGCDGRARCVSRVSGRVWEMLWRRGLCPHTQPAVTWKFNPPGKKIIIFFKCTIVILSLSFLKFHFSSGQISLLEHGFPRRSFTTIMRMHQQNRSEI